MVRPLHLVFLPITSCRGTILNQLNYNPRLISSSTVINIWNELVQRKLVPEALPNQHDPVSMRPHTMGSYPTSMSSRDSADSSSIVRPDDHAGQYNIAASAVYTNPMPVPVPFFSPVPNYTTPFFAHQTDVSTEFISSSGSSSPETSPEPSDQGYKTRIDFLLN